MRREEGREQEEEERDITVDSITWITLHPEYVKEFLPHHEQLPVSGAWTRQEVRTMADWVTGLRFGLLSRGFFSQSHLAGRAWRPGQGI